MTTVRLGVVGAGNMGSSHAAKVQEGAVRRCELVAVCDEDPARLKKFEGKVKTFTDPRGLLRPAVVDAVLIATPHYAHTTVGIAALRRGLHVLVEKPISVHKADCERLIAAHKSEKQVFAAMFNQRTDPHYRAVKTLIQEGKLGELVRVTWIITNWFRTEHYYASGGWRATWAGEGGGVLLNQCPHNLDMLQWLCGMPKKVWGFCAFGKRHNVEVEDEVTAYLEFANGATGTFITTTGEAPGTNRLEIAGDYGKVVVGEGNVRFTRNKVSASEYCRTSNELFKRPDTEEIEIPVQGHGGQHVEVLQNFVDAILDGAPLIAPAREGIHSVELGNAILASAWTGKPAELPLNGRSFERMLKKRVRESRFVKKAAETREVADLSSSYR